MKHYNYIFAGAGLATLMTVYKIVLSGKFTDKTILIIDKDEKKINDKTWSFWENKNSLWDNCVFKKWDEAVFLSPQFSKTINLIPYQYKTIKSEHFYKMTLEVILKQKNIAFLKHEVLNFSQNKNNVEVQTTNDFFTCDKLFNSILNKKILESGTQYPVLQQHFTGWFIKSKEEVFNPNQVVFMDFTVEQKNNTRFMYILPTSKNEALVEYTLFSKTILPKKEYENELKKYIKKLGITKYEIIDKEFGVIPMTCFPFWKQNTKKCLNIGTAGGWTKPSSGYTFKNSDKKSSELILFLQNSKKNINFYPKKRFWFYDLIFTDVLSRKNILGSSLFSSLFKKEKNNLVFKFLDEETSFFEDIKIILRCPKIPFIKSLFRVIKFFFIK